MMELGAQAIHGQRHFDAGHAIEWVDIVSLAFIRLDMLVERPVDVGPRVLGVEDDARSLEPIARAHDDGTPRRELLEDCILDARVHVRMLISHVLQNANKDGLVVIV